VRLDLSLASEGAPNADFPKAEECAGGLRVPVDVWALSGLTASFRIEGLSMWTDHFRRADFQQSDTVPRMTAEGDDND